MLDSDHKNLDVDVFLHITLHSSHFFMKMIAFIGAIFVEGHNQDLYMQIL